MSEPEMTPEMAEWVRLNGPAQPLSEEQVEDLVEQMTQAWEDGDTEKASAIQAHLEAAGYHVHPYGNGSTASALGWAATGVLSGNPKMVAITEYGWPGSLSRWQRLRRWLRWRLWPEEVKLSDLADEDDDEMLCWMHAQNARMYMVLTRTWILGAAVVYAAVEVVR